MTMGTEPTAPTVQQTQPSRSLAHRLSHLSESLGQAAIPELRDGLRHPEPWVRMHAVEGLGRIDGEEAREGLVAALHDDSFGVHWEAARALCAAGRAGVITVLRALLHDTPSTGFLHGAAYVLRHAPLSYSERQALLPLLEALRHPAADLEAPVAAFAALQQLAPEDVTPTQQLPPWYDGLRRHRPSRGTGITPSATAESAP